MTTPAQQISLPSGLVVCTTYGSITQQTAGCLMAMRSHTERMGLHNIEWQMIPGTLVEKARNEAVRMMLRNGHGWIFFVDGDTTFDPDSLVAVTEGPQARRPGLLQTAFGVLPSADAIGGWVPLRGDLALPTIDSGTGTWESHYPGSGIIPVMRTGGAFLLAKRHVFEALRDPWFRLRVPARAMDFMAELDNWLRIKFNGQNPFREYGDYWAKAEKAAQDDPSIVIENFVPVEVGEDSGACDRMKLAGFNIFVDTDIVCGHVDQVVLDWRKHKSAMEDGAKWQRLACGLLA